MVKKEYWNKKTPIELKIGDKKSKGTLCDFTNCLELVIKQ